MCFGDVAFCDFTKFSFSFNRSNNDAGIAICFWLLMLAKEKASSLLTHDGMHWGFLCANPLHKLPPIVIFKPVEFDRFKSCETSAFSL
jgi:hypothetical protein